VGTTWRDQNFDDDEDDRSDASWLDSDRAPGEATPFGTPPERHGSVRRWFRQLFVRD
jgi:hypothetical protein